MKWLLLAILLIPAASATSGLFATFQPDNVAAQWHTGQSLRICPQEAPTTSATVTAPSGAISTLAGDSEGCWSLTPDESGTWTASWGVAGPATRTVNFPVWGSPPFEGGFWAELAFWVLVFAFCWYFQALYVLTFALGGVWHLINPHWFLDLNAILPLLGLGAFLELITTRRRQRKERGRT